MPEQPLFCITLTNAGGEGKTMITSLLRAVLDLGGVESYGLDADQGNWALKNRYGADIHTDALPWSVGASAAQQILTKAAGRSVFMDAGANMLVAYSAISDLLPALRDVFGRAGYRTAALLPLSPNKSGGAGGITQLFQKLDGFEKFVVFNHRDRSGEFGELDPAIPTIAVQHLWPGLQAYLFSRGVRLTEAVTKPEPEYHKAARHIGLWIRAFCQDGSVRELLSPTLCDRALGCLPPPPSRIDYALETLDQVSDDNIATLERQTQIIDLLDRHSWSPRGLRAAADVLEKPEQR